MYRKLEKGIEDELVRILKQCKVIVTFNNCKSQAYCGFDLEGNTDEIVVPWPTTERRALTVLHELGHFNDLDQNPKLQEAYNVLLSDEGSELLQSHEWISILASEIRAWRNAVAASKSNGWTFSPEAWESEIYGGLKAYYRSWEDHFKAPPKNVQKWIKVLFNEIEEVAPGFL